MRGCKVQVGRWLVKEKNICVHGPRGQDGDELSLAAGQLVDIAILQPLQMKHTEGLLHPLTDGFLRQAEILQPEGHFIRAVHGKKLTSRILKHRSRQLADLADTQSGGVLPVQAAKAF